MLEKLLSDLERAASASEVTGAREAADELIQYVTHVQVIYRRATHQAETQRPLDVAL
jgi:hypothetical protein